MCGRFNRGGRIPWPLKVLGALIFIPGLLLLGTFVFMSLWNVLMPELFGLTVIRFWQAMGLIVIAKILFAGHGGGRRGFPRKPRFKDREAWKDHMRERFADDTGGFHGHRGRHEHQSDDPPRDEEPSGPV